MAVASITSKGQVTIPKDVRERLNLRMGDKLDFQIAEDGSIRIRPMSNRVDDVFGILHDLNGQAFSIREIKQRMRSSLRGSSR